MALPSHGKHGMLPGVLSAVVLVAAAMLISGCTTLSTNATNNTPTSLGGPCPNPNANMIPAAWQPQGGGALINIDGDNDAECLMIYRYNVTGDNQGPLGGIIFDPQVSAGRLSDLAAYRLLPWINRPFVITDTVPGSLPGYLGALGEKGYEARQYDTDNNGKADELGIVGSDAAGNRTYLSLYRWVSSSDGYRLVGYFHGNLRVEIADSLAFSNETKLYSGAARTVRAVDRFYDRSGLAMVYEYTRKDDGPRFEYRSNSVVYADGKPAKTCFFPEGQTLNYYSDVGRPVFDLRVFYEDDRSRRATVCAGSWELSSNQWRRYWALVELEELPSSGVTGCDAWVVRRELIEPGRISCQP